MTSPLGPVMFCMSFPVTCFPHVSWRELMESSRLTGITVPAATTRAEGAGGLAVPGYAL